MFWPEGNVTEILLKKKENERYFPENKIVI